MANLDIQSKSPIHAMRRDAQRGAVSPQASGGAIRLAFAALALLTDVAAIMGAAVLVAAAWHSIRYMSGLPDNLLAMCAAIAMLLVVPSALAHDYDISRYLSFRGHAGRLFSLWNIAFLAALAIAFMTQTSAQFSRAALAGLYVTGYGALILARLALVAYAKSATRRTKALRRRLMLVGEEQVVRDFAARFDPLPPGLDIVSAALLRGEDSTLKEDLDLAAAYARMTRPHDILVLLPWSQEASISACMDAFLRIPAALHLGPERVLDRFDEAHISRIGPIASLSLVRGPLTAQDVFIKRMIDLILACGALVLLSPLLALVALAIRLDSPGPALFSQRRYGFNQEPFRIFKFRSMRVSDDGPNAASHSPDLERITRVGAFIRRWNIDELPQLINVIRGEMSLVGPRPHAMSHDQAFAAKIALYARRHNVRPGMTGWAQVNGYRGVTDTDEKMRSRIAHDLYYIDNWTLLLDFRILVLTLVSPKAYRNAR